MKISVFTHVGHSFQDGSYLAYPPYVREMNLWFKCFTVVEVAGPLEREDPGWGMAYHHRELRFSRLPLLNFTSWRNMLKSFFLLPVAFISIFKLMGRAEHIHLRCPGNIGLLASICQIFFPKKPKTAKYAGNWDSGALQPWSYRLQKWILRNPFLSRNMKVLVYGDWPSQSGNVYPFFTASFEEREVALMEERSFRSPFRFLFVGNLVKGKNPHLALELVEELLHRKFAVSLDVFGDGPERAGLEQWCREKNLQTNIRFHGNIEQKALRQFYRNVHFCLLPSRSEGWPKAIAEAMFFGCIPIATSISCVPWMLDHGRRGILLDPLGKDMDKNAWLKKGADKITLLLKNEPLMKEVSSGAISWSRQYTLEKFEAGIKEVLVPKGEGGAGIRVLQLIDSLRPGGAERMAVNYANALLGKVEASFLCCTRKEGSLKKDLDGRVEYLLLRKRHSLDVRALVRLRNFICSNQVNLVQAHGSSFFLAALIKVFIPGLKLVWHDHNGNKTSRKGERMVLKATSISFDGVFAASSELMTWGQNHLLAKRIWYVKNFLPPPNLHTPPKTLRRKGPLKIVCVANLRPEKDHLNLLKAFQKLCAEFPGVRLHLVGKDYNDWYSKKIQDFIQSTGITEHVFLHGERSDISIFLEEMHIGVLSSKAEAQPVVLLEYARARLPVVCTNVGGCAEVLLPYGKVVPSEEPDKLLEGLRHYITHGKERKQDAAKLREKVLREFSQEAVIEKLLPRYGQIMYTSQQSTGFYGTPLSSP